MKKRIKKFLATSLFLLGVVALTGSNADAGCLWNPTPQSVKGACTWSGEYGHYCETVVVPFENCTIGPPPEIN